MTPDIEKQVREVMGNVQQSAQQGWQQVQQMATGKPQETGISKAANDALEYIREMLKNGAELATTAFNGAVEMGKGAYDNITQSQQRSGSDTTRRRGGRE